MASEDDELNEELTIGEQTANAFAEHLHRMGADYTERTVILSDGAIYKVTVRHEGGVIV
jgi:hypothetical protein